MPFGIRPAPEVFRSKMNEGSRGLEVIANDFVVLRQSPFVRETEHCKGGVFWKRCSRECQ